MEFIAKINHLEDIYLLSKADAFLLSHQKFSYRFDESFNIAKIKKVKNYCLKNHKKVYVSINKIFKDEQLDELKTFMQKLIEISIDGFFFTDFAVFMIAKELNVQSKCYFAHETFLRNTLDIMTYQQLGISNIICSKDMHIDDMKHLPIKQKNHYGILCFGYVPLYESERKIVTHYIKAQNLDSHLLQSKELYLKEETRDEKYRVLEQKGIASIFNSKVLSYLLDMKELAKHIELFLFDELFLDARYLNKVMDLFHKACIEEVSIDELKELDNSIMFTDGFLNQRIGLM